MNLSISGLFSHTFLKSLVPTFISIVYQGFFIYIKIHHFAIHYIYIFVTFIWRISYYISYLCIFVVHYTHICVYCVYQGSVKEIKSLLFCDPLYIFPLYPGTHICVYCVLYQGSAAQTRLSGTGTVMGSSISTHCTSFSPQVRK